MEMIPSTVGTQDFRLIGNQQELTNLDINAIHGWIESFTKWNPRISVSDGKLQSGKLFNCENGWKNQPNMSNVHPPFENATWQSCKRICTIRSCLHGICTTQTSTERSANSTFSECRSIFFLTHAHDSRDVLSRSW